MLLNTPYGVTNSRTGEILDLRPLRRAVKPSKRRYRRSRPMSHSGELPWLLAFVATLVAGLALMS